MGWSRTSTSNTGLVPLSRVKVEEPLTKLVNVNSLETIQTMSNAETAAFAGIENVVLLPGRCSHKLLSCDTKQSMRVWAHVLLRKFE